MKKTITITLAILFVFVFSTAAFALNRAASFPKTHYGFAQTAEGCAGCHVIHTANVAKLLKSGDTQTEFCYSCHGSNDSSPYDVETGTILSKDTLVLSQSMAGFFGFTSNYKDGGVETSRHQVEVTVGDSTYAATGIPGNLNSGSDWNFSGGFKCASCHDPHAGDKANDRLLRSSIVGWSAGTGSTVTNTIDFAYGANTLVTESYGTSKNAALAINEFCALCHGKFNAPDNGAKTMYNSKYRHAMGIGIRGDGTTTLPLGNPDATYSNDTNLVLCVTCHYPHGSDKAITGYNTWDIDGAQTFSGSVLLRLDKRDVCYNCHGAAQFNTERSGEALN